MGVLGIEVVNESEVEVDLHEARGGELVSVAVIPKGKAHMLHATPYPPLCRYMVCRKDDYTSGGLRFYYHEVVLNSHIIVKSAADGNISLEFLKDEPSRLSWIERLSYFCIC